MAMMAITIIIADDRISRGKRYAQLDGTVTQ